MCGKDNDRDNVTRCAKPAQQLHSVDPGHEEVEQEQITLKIRSAQQLEGSLSVHCFDNLVADRRQRRPEHEPDVLFVINNQDALLWVHILPPLIDSDSSAALAAGRLNVNVVPSARLAVDTNLAPMGRDDLADDCEAQAGPSGMSSRRDAVELFENVSDVLGCDPLAVVFDHEFGVLAVTSRATPG